MSTDWIEISVRADGEAAEAVSELFNRLNSRPDGQGGAVTEVGGFDPVGEAHQPIVNVRTYLPADVPDTPERQRQIEEGLWFLGRIHPLGEPSCAAWPKKTGPMPGRHTITRCASAGASWSSRPGRPAKCGRKPGELAIVLDPGMAFGTGLHPSTQLCLRAMEEVVGPGQRVLDAGCGSGILSIAAARLGARRVDAFDIDPLAVDATAANAALNDLPSADQCLCGGRARRRAPSGQPAGRLSARPGM